MIAIRIDQFIAAATANTNDMCAILDSRDKKVIRRANDVTTNGDTFQLKLTQKTLIIVEIFSFPWYKDYQAGIQIRSFEIKHESYNFSVYLICTLTGNATDIKQPTKPGARYRIVLVTTTYDNAA